MICRRLFQFVILVLASLAWFLALAAEQNAAGLTMVKKLRLGENLSTMSYQVAAATQTYRILAQSVGPDKAQVLVKEGLDKARPKYQDLWDKNLAASYSEFFAANELESLAEEQKNSPFASKFFAKQGEVGQSMQAKSAGLLKEFVSEALKNGSHEVKKSPNPAVDTAPFGRSDLAHKAARGRSPLR